MTMHTHERLNNVPQQLLDTVQRWQPCKAGLLGGLCQRRARGDSHASSCGADVVIDPQRAETSGAGAQGVVAGRVRFPRPLPELAGLATLGAAVRLSAGPV